MSRHHIAQVNIARMRAPLDDSIMAGFVARLDEINALFKNTFPADENYIKTFDFSIFKPCPTAAG